MGKANFDKIILLTCLLVGFVLFYQNQKNYSSTLSTKQVEISNYKIAQLERKHFDLRNKFVQFNNADKYGLAISNLFLDCLLQTEGISDIDHSFQKLASYDQIKLFIPEKRIHKLKSTVSILEYLLEMFEEVVNQNNTAHHYKSEFTAFVENLDVYDEHIIFNLTPFESYQIPKGHLTATLNGDTLATNAIPNIFCYEPSNVEFKSKLGSSFIIDNDSEIAWP